MSKFFIAAVATFIGMFIALPIFFGLARLLGLYTVVEERQCKVYNLFGKAVAVIDQPGLHLLFLKLGLKAPLVSLLGKCEVLDLRLDQAYLRSTAVNSEERPWASASGMKWSSAIRWPTSSRTPTRADRWRPTSATPPSAA
jgi:hypothetical protein